jgi:hypothetical protein
MNIFSDRFALKHRVFAFPHTDRGVQSNFFDTVLSSGDVDVLFGTAAPRQDSINRSFQRFSAEKSGVPMDAVLARYSLKGLYLRLVGEKLCVR